MILVVDTWDRKLKWVVDWNGMYEKMVQVPQHSIRNEMMMNNYLLNRDLLYQPFLLLVLDKQFVYKKFH
jgi:hypothetical protein